MLKVKLALIGVVGLLLTIVTPVAAITYGQLDAGEHPYVGFLIFFVPSEPGWFSCTGTALDARTVLTAGHCTVDVGTNGADTGSRSGGTDMWVTFRSTDVLAGWPLRADHPGATEQEIYQLRSAWLNDPAHGFVRAVSHPDPAFDDFASFPVNNDLGIVTLPSDARAGDGSLLTSFGTLAPLGTVDRMAAQPSTRNDALIETVGYGVQSETPHFSPQEEDTRYKSTSRIVEVNGSTSRGGNLHTLNNPSAVGGRGGSCFGDSGGPLFVNNTNQIVAVVSFGFSATCHGADYSWRVDTVPSQQFISSWLD